MGVVYLCVFEVGDGSRTVSGLEVFGIVFGAWFLLYSRPHIYDVRLDGLLGGYGVISAFVLFDRVVQ